MKKLAAPFLYVVAAVAPAVQAQASQQSADPSPVYVDAKGKVRWTASREEVRLFGANYCAYAGSDYRMAGLVKADRKALIDRDIAHFARMGWDGLRICTWGDWEHADGEGNLVENDHLDLMEYTIAKAAERGIQILLTPTHTYNPGFADQSNNPDYKPPGFSSRYDRAALVRDPKAIAAQKRYISQLLNHVNPYTGKAIKNHANIIFFELINEPVHNSRDIPQSVSYINDLVGAVRQTGAGQVTFYNLSQDFGIAPAIVQSRIDGVSFGWYPSGLVSGYELKGNFLPAVRDYPPMLDSRVANKPRIVYEFDQGDLNTGYLFPAMARTMRSVGTQFAAIFAYDLLETAPYNLSWQTHFINLVHTPRQAISGVIASEVMDRLSVEQARALPDASRFGDFWVDYPTDASGLAAADAYMNAGDTDVAPKAGRGLKRVVGVGSSPVVSYEGTGAYFLDKLADGVWRLEVYPDQILVSDPFAQPRPDKVVSRLYSRAWPMSVSLPDLGPAFDVGAVNVPGHGGGPAAAEQGIFTVRPGVWLLTRGKAPPRQALPEVVNHVRFDEYHVNAPREYADMVLPASPAAFVAGAPAEIKVRFASETLPPSLDLYLRPLRGAFRRPIAMKRVRGDTYAASVPDLESGYYEYIVVDSRGEGRAYPDSIAGRPGKWPFSAKEMWRFSVTDAATPLNLFTPAADIGRTVFPRLREDLRSSVFKVVPGETSAVSALALAVPEVVGGPSSYSAGLFIGDRVAARGTHAAAASSVAVRVRSDTGRKTLEVVLVEKDGSSWRGAIVATDEWQTISVPLDRMAFSRSTLMPTPFPGLWSYWRTGPESRASTRIRPEAIERLELRVNRNAGDTASDTSTTVFVESVDLGYSM